MYSSFAVAALAAVAYAAPAPQGVTQDLSPTAAAPAGCSPSYAGTFQIAAVNVTAAHKRDLEERQTSCGSSGSLTLTLAGGKLTDAQGRTGYIASNYQFQFDAPPQAGTIYNDGFSACSNGSLALGGSTVWYRCLSGEFYNLYDRHWAAQCSPIALQILPCAGSGASPTPVGQVPDGQATGTAVGAPVTQISDGQPQATTGTLPVVTQIGDGQPQAPSILPVTQIGDGQIQAPTKTLAPVTQIGDGQIQAPTGTATLAPVTQISDGQIQAPTTTLAPVTQISDGQIQAPTSTLAPVTQISDGQIQAPANTTVPATPKPSNTTTLVPVTGEASGRGWSSTLAVAVIGLVSVFLL